MGMLVQAGGIFRAESGICVLRTRMKSIPQFSECADLLLRRKMRFATMIAAGRLMETCCRNGLWGPTGSTD